MSMDAAETREPLVRDQSRHRSSVSNGSRLFAVDGIDGRSSTARRFRDLVETIGADLGGWDHISEGQKQLIRRAATLSIMAESMEADAVRDIPFDTEAYGILVDRLGRCLQRLGLERVARPVDGPQTIDAIARHLRAMGIATYDRRRPPYPRQ